MKTCCECHRELPSDLFYKQKVRKDGLRSQCKDCDRKRQAAHQAKPEAREKQRLAAAAQRASDPEKSKARAKAWRAKNADYVRKYNKANSAAFRAANPDYNRDHYAKNKDRLNQQSRAYYAAHKDYFREYNRNWTQQNRDASRAIARRNRAKRKGAAGSFNSADILRIRKAQRGRCAYCQCRLTGKVHIDHILPVSKGGTNWPRNLQLTCSFCNQSKKDRLPEDFARRLGKLI